MKSGPVSASSFALLFGLAAAAGGCSSGPPANPGDGVAKSQVITSAGGGTITVTPSDSMALAGTSIRIPAGALSSDTTITISPSPISVSHGAQGAAGPVVRFGPDGTKFLAAATVTLPFALAGGVSVNQLEVAGQEADGTALLFKHGQLTIDSAASTVAFQVTGFTDYGAVVDNGGAGSDGGSAGPDAGSGGGAPGSPCMNGTQCASQECCVGTHCCGSCGGPGAICK